MCRDVAVNSFLISVYQNPLPSACLAPVQFPNQVPQLEPDGAATARPQDLWLPPMDAIVSHFREHILATGAN